MWSTRCKSTNLYCKSTQHMTFWFGVKNCSIISWTQRTDTWFPQEATQACQDDTCKLVEKSHRLNTTLFTFDLVAPCTNDISTPIAF